jgi:hypothetical protein
MKIRIDVPLTAQENKRINRMFDETGRKRQTYTRILLLEATEKHEAEKKARAIAQKVPQ